MNDRWTSKDDKQPMIRKLPVCFIVTTGRNGSLFLQSLLDEHSEILMFPATMLLQKFIDKNPIDSTNYTTVVEAFTDEFPELFFPNVNFIHNFHKLGEKKNTLVTIDSNKFIDLVIIELEKVSIVDFASFYFAIHYAYEVVRNGNANIHSKKVIVHHIHHIEDLVGLKNFFISLGVPLKCLTMSRDPRDSIKSSTLNWAKYHCRTDVRHFYRQFLRSLVDVSPVMSYGNDINILAVKLESLHSNSALTIEKIIEFLGVGFETSLMKSTFFGHTWWGDKLSGGNKNGFNPNFAPSKVKVGFYSMRDLRLLSHYYRKRLCNYNYEEGPRTFGFFSNVILLLTPFKFEVSYLRQTGHCKDIPSGKFTLRLGNCLINGLIFRLKLIKESKINKNYLKLNVI